MWKYICKRIAVLIPLIFLVSFIVYALMDFAPGDPVRSLVGENMTEEQLEQKREELGFNDPLLVRYGRYMKGVFQGDFGKSMYGGKDVLTEYMSRLPSPTTPRPYPTRQLPGTRSTDRASSVKCRVPTSSAASCCAPR